MAWSVPATPNNQWLIVNNFFSSILGNVTEENKLLCYAYAQGYTGIIINNITYAQTSAVVYNTFANKSTVDFGIKIAAKVSTQTEAADFITHQNNSGYKFASVVVDFDHTSYNGNFTANSFIAKYKILNTNYNLFKGASTSVPGFNVIANISVNNFYNTAYKSRLATLASANPSTNTITFDWTGGAGKISNGDVLKLYNYPSINSVTTLTVANSSINGSGQLVIQPTSAISTTIISGNGSSYITYELKSPSISSASGYITLTGDKSWMFTTNGANYSGAFTPPDYHQTIQLIDASNYVVTKVVSFVEYISASNSTRVTFTNNSYLSFLTGVVTFNPDIVGDLSQSYDVGVTELESLFNYADEFVVLNSNPIPAYSLNATGTNSPKSNFSNLATPAVTLGINKKVGFAVNADTSNTFFTGGGNNPPTYPRKNSLAAYKYMAVSTALSPTQTLYAAQETNTNITTKLALNSLIVDNYTSLRNLEIGNGDNIYLSFSNPTGGTAPGTATVNIGFCDDCLGWNLSGVPYYTVTYTLTSAPAGAIIGTNCGFQIGGLLGASVTYGTSSTGNITIPPQQTLQFAIPGTYSGTIAISDTSGVNQKTITKTFTTAVGSPAPLVVTTTQTASSSCYLGGQNKLIVSVTGGGTDGPFTYQVYNPGGVSLGPSGTSSSSTFTVNNIGTNYTTPGSNFGTGTYTININDIAPGYTNPVGTYSFNIVDKDPVVITGVFTGQATCYGYSNGGVEVSVTGGTGTYNYTWSPGTHPNSPIITGLSAGNYTVQVTDSNGCASTVVPFTITEPPQITYTSNVTAPTCYGGADGSISLIASGGVGNYTYTWTPNVSNSSNATGLTAGSYNCTIFDSNLCPLSVGPIVVLPGPALNFTITGPTNVCYNPSTKYTYTVTNAGANTGPYTYLWSNAVTTPQPTTAQSDSSLYTIDNAVNNIIYCTITDSNGCETTVSKTVNLKTIGSFTAANYQVTGTLTQCAGSNITVAVTNSSGLGFWNNPSGTTSTSLTVNNSYFTVGDPNNIMAVTESVPIISAVGTGTSIIYTTATNHNFTGDPKQYITVSGITPSNFNTIGIATIISPTSFSLPSSATHAATNYSSATASTTYVDFIWTEIDTSVTCMVVSDAVRVYAPQPITLSATVTAVTCNSPSPNVGAITVTVLSGCPAYTYAWTRDGDGSFTAFTPNLTALVSDMYHVTITDANSNTATYSIKVPVSIPEVTSATIINTCNNSNNGSISVVVAGGTAPYTYLWTLIGDPNFQRSTPTITGLAPGNYQLDISDSYACTNTYAYGVNPADPIVFNYTVIPPSCAGLCDGEIIWNSTTGGSGAGGYTYAWSDPIINPKTGASTIITTPSRTKLCANGTYQIAITDANGCNLIQTITVPPTSPPITITSIINDPNAQTGTLGSINITSTQGGGGPGYTYTWYDGNGNSLCNGKVCTNVLTDLTSGIYYVTISGPNNGCSQSFSFTLSARCNMFSVPELKLQLYKFQCCAGKLAEKYVQYQNVGRPDLAQCLLADLKYLTLALEALTCITDLPDPCLSCDDISNILDQMKKICDCDCCLDAGDHTYQVSYNYTTGVFTPLLPAIN